MQCTIKCCLVTYTQKNDGLISRHEGYFTNSYIIKKMTICVLKMTRYKIITMSHNRALCLIYIDTVIYQILCVCGKIQTGQTQQKIGTLPQVNVIVNHMTMQSWSLTIVPYLITLRHTFKIRPNSPLCVLYVGQVPLEQITFS